MQCQQQIAICFNCQFNVNLKVKSEADDDFTCHIISHQSLVVMAKEKKKSPDCICSQRACVDANTTRSNVYIKIYAPMTTPHSR